MPEKISVCMPVFNGDRFLERSITSILKQSYSDFKLIITDDGSSDNSADIISKFAAQDNRIEFSKNDTRLGLFGNYNKCLSQAKGEIVKLFAQDDVLLSDCLKRINEVFERYPEVVLLSSHRDWIDEDGDLLPISVTSTADYFETDVPLQGREIIYQSLMMLDNFIGEPCTVAFRKDFAAEGFDTSFHHIGDLEYWLRLLEHGQYYFISETLCKFRSHAENASEANARLLLPAIDFLRLGRKSKTTIEKYGHSLDEYTENVILSLSNHYRSLADQGYMSPEQLRENVAENISELNAKGDYLLSDFMELALHALLALSRRRGGEGPDSLDGLDEIAKIKFLEKRLRNLLRSPSWLTTVQLRQASKMYKILTRTGSYGIDAHDPDGDFESKYGSSHEAYLAYLQSQITKIRASRSWRITRPLRALARSYRIGQ